MSKLFYAGIRTCRRLSSAKQGGYVFCVNDGSSRFFIQFDDLDEFGAWYKALNPSMRVLSEVVRSDVRKLILDIDSPRNCRMLDKLLMYDFERHVTARIHDTFFALDIGVPEVAFYSMCEGKDKLSYHVVVSNFMFSAHTCLGLCDIISSGQPWECCVDRGVYKRVQFIRIEDSTKPGECRWKKRLNKGPLRQGMLSDPVGTVVSGFTAAIGYNRSQDVMVCQHSVGDQFRVGKLYKNIVPLYRTKPGFCYQCNRVHDRENAFIRYCAGVQVFTCWRYLAGS